MRSTPSTVETPSEFINVKKMDRREYVITDPGCQILGCLTCPLHFMPLFPGFLGTKVLILEDEEAIFQVRGGIYDVNTRRPYGELGSVDRVNCLCCSGVSSSLFRGFILCPGWGCEHDKVDEVVAELKRRMKSRGDTGNIRRIEAALAELQTLRGEVGEIKANIEVMMKALNLAPVENTMTR